MPGKYFARGTQRAPRVQDLFAALAPRYDLINDLQSLGGHRLWKRQLVTLAAPRPGERALDACCGTGDIAFALAAAGAQTIGFDFSPAMLEVARRRQAQSCDPKVQAVRFGQGDALNLPFADASFDLVTIGYGLRNLVDVERGLRELTRVLKPEGRLLVLEFGKPDNALLRWCYFQHLRWVCPIFGRLFCGDAETHKYILESLKEYPGQRGVDATLKCLGYAETRIHQILGGMMSVNYARQPRATTP